MVGRATIVPWLESVVPWLETTFMVGMSTMVSWLETLFIDENTIHGGNGLVWYQRSMVGNDFHGWGWLVYETSERVFTFCM